MPIYSGDWRDAEGRPFDPVCYPRPSDKTGKVSQKRTRTHGRSYYARGHYNALQWLASQWNNVLTQQQRDDWQLISPICVSNRDYKTPDVWNGFVAFANRNWPVAYGMPGVYNQAVTATSTYLSGCWLMTAIAATQLMKIRLTFDQPPGFDSNMTVYLYHCNPKCPSVYYAHRWTRLSLAFRNFNDVDAIYEPEFPMQWTQDVGETATVYVKHTYQYSWLDPYLQNTYVQ